MRFQDVIFDLYGTLVDIRTDEESPALWEEMARLYAVEGAVYAPEELKRRYFSTVAELERGSASPGGDAHEAHPEIALGAVFRRLFLEKGAAADGALVQRVGRRFREASTRFIRLYPGARELLTALRERGLGVWLLSNAQAMFTRPELEALGIDRLFDGVYLSSDYGIKKPDSRFFRALLEERRIDPAAAVMVGNDGECDIRGARELGLAAVYVRSEISPREPLPQADLALEETDLERVRRFLLEA